MSVNVYIDKAERGTAALIDSGAMGKFIHEDMVKQLNLTRTPRTPLPLLDVKGIRIGELLHQVTLHMCIGAHEERITLDVAPIGNHRLILGLPWLQAHDPDVTWSTGRIRFASPYCNVHCMPHPNDVFARQQPVTTLSYLNIEIFATVMRMTCRFFFFFFFFFLSRATAAVHTFEGSNQLLGVASTLEMPRFSRTLTQ